jgi:signal transduction histidine kinase
MKKLLNCLVAGFGIGGAAWWIRGRRNEEKTFQELLRGLTVGPNPGEVLHRIAERSAKLLNGSAAYVERIDADRGEIVADAVYNGRDLPAVGTRGPYRGSVAEHVIQTGQATIIRNVRLESRSILASLKRDSPAVVLPLLTDSTPLGALIVLLGKSRYNSRSLVRVQTMADMSAVSLRRAIMLDKLEQALRTKDELTRVLAHDLRNPLNTIAMVTRRLRDSRTTEREQSNLLEMIDRSTSRMNRLIQDVIDNAVIERRGELPLNPTEHQVQNLAEEVCEQTRIQAQTKTVHVRCEIQGQVTVYGDRDRLLQVLTNLVDNALKFTPKGGTITVKSELQDHEIRFSVSDTGPGIPAADRDRVFEAYWRAPHTELPGAGLGLAIAKQIVEQHGGRIWVESQEGQGSTFIFAIPANPN